MNKLKHFLFLLVMFFILIVSFFISPFSLQGYSTGPLDAKTGAPGEGVCTECHLGNPLNSSGGSLTITGIPSNYALDTNYSITVTLTRSGVSRFGFEATAKRTSNNSVIGSFIAGTGTQVSDGYIKHTFEGTTGSGGSKSWTFTWRSPSSNVGEIKFYAAGNATNSSGNEFGDFIYTTSSNPIIIVPVELASFDYGIIEGNKIQLHWSTLSKTNNYGFEIERSSDGEHFVKVDFVKGNGTSSAIYNYKYIDKINSQGEYYYRLKQMDFDGSYEYSLIIKVTIDNPAKYYLSQCYPNPFNPETTIEYALPVFSKVTVIIYDILGQEVKTLMDEEKQAGYYSVKWDGTNNLGMKVSNGMYVCLLRSGNFIDVKKMVFLQ